MGRYFPELEMSTKLLSLRVAADKKENEKLDLGGTGIEVLSSSYATAGDADEIMLTEEFGSSDKKMGSNSIESLSLGRSEETYGFNNKYKRIFQNLREVFFDLLELPEPDSTPAGDRRILR